MTMIAPETAGGKGFLSIETGGKTCRIRCRPITNSLNAPTITPNFRQSPVTLDWDKASVASRPGPVRAPDSSAPQPPGARSAGPVEFRVRFNPLMPSGRRGAGPIFLRKKFFARSAGSICRAAAAGSGRNAQHRTRLARHTGLNDDIETVDVLEREIALWNFADRDAERLRGSIPVAELHPAAHHVVVGQRTVLVLATPDLHRRLACDGTEPDLAAAVIAVTGRDSHRHFAVSYGHLHRQREDSGIEPCFRDCLFDRRLVTAKRMRDAIDHHLRRVDLAVAARLGVCALPVSVAMQCQGVFPAEVIPIVDGKTHGHQRRVA